MIGLVSKTRPTLTVQRYDIGRQRVVRYFSHEALIEVIAGHLRQTGADGRSLREMYAGLPHPRRWRPSQQASASCSLA